VIRSEFDSRNHLLIGFLGFIMIGMGNAAPGVAWTHIQRQFEISLDNLGLLLGAMTIGRLVLSVYSGSVIRWLGLGDHMLVGSGIMLVGLAGFALAPTWETLLLMALVYGIGGAMINTGVNTHGAAYYSSARMNSLHASFGFGAAMGPLIVTIVAIHLSLMWQWSYVIFAAVQVTLTAVLFLTRRRWKLPDTPISDDPQQRNSPTLIDSSRLRAVQVVSLLIFLHGGIQYGVAQLTDTLLTQSRGVDPAIAGTGVSLFWAALTAGRMFSGVAMAHLNTDRFMRINMLLTAAGAVMVWSNLAHVVTFAGIALMGFTLGPIIPTLLAETSGRTGSAHVANAVGLQIAAAGVGIAVLPGIAAFVADRAGLETIGAYLFIVAGASVVLYEFLLRFDRGRRDTKLPAASVTRS